MTLLEWRSDYECGVASIDHEHREMIQVINDFYDKLTGECSDQIVAFYMGEIHALIESHFALEEKLMRQSGYPDYGPHKADHDRLLDDLRDIMDDTHMDSTMSRDALGTRLQSWFSIHFSTMDRDLPQLAGRLK